MRIMDHVNEPASFGIPGLIFQAKFTKFGTRVGLKMLININSGFFFIIGKKKIGEFVSHFATSHMAKSPLALSRP